MQTEPAPLLAVETDGARIRLDDGRWLIDGTASWWTAVHGYNHPHITAAIKKQIDAMPHVMFGGLTHEPALELASRLAGLLPGAGFFSGPGKMRLHRIFPVVRETHTR